MDFQKTFASNFSAYTASILKIPSKKTDNMGIKWIVFEVIQNTHNSQSEHKMLSRASCFISDILYHILNST